MGAELSTRETIVQQFNDYPVAIVGAVALFAVATFIPVLRGSKADSIGPFTPSAELLNGRAAMIGLVLMLALEANSGQALF